MKSTAKPMAQLTTKFYKITVFIALLGVFSCSEDDETPRFRDKLSYSELTPETTYSSLFLNEEGDSTVDLMDGNFRLKMFQALHYQSSFSIARNLHIDSDSLIKQFSNTDNRFKDISTSSIKVNGDSLNNSEVQLRNVVASSLSDTEAEAARLRLETLFEEIEEASHAFERESNVASNGVSGKLGNYLVDEKGIEIIQVIQKSLIGALQLDYIGNVLLQDGLDANNSKVVDGKKYTQLEHNWDVAYGLLTLNQIYLEGATAEAKGPKAEFGLGSYIWEYNRANFATIYPAFLKGRAAIVNNDRDEVKKQAMHIREHMEKAIASAALGYLAKWKSLTGGASDDPARAHAIGEGLGFIYSLRFATFHDVDAEFSDQVLEDLIGSENGFWDLTTIKVTAAEDAIKAKFGL
jgi:hypothetical protein